MNRRSGAARSVVRSDPPPGGLIQVDVRDHSKSVMKTVELSLTQIGNSRGIRLSAELIRRHGFEQDIVMEDRGCETVLRSKGGTRKLSWKETYREMAAVSEECSEWECVVGDGLEDAPWEHPIPPAVLEWARHSAAPELRRRRGNGERDGTKAARTK